MRFDRGICQHIEAHTSAHIAVAGSQRDASLEAVMCVALFASSWVHRMHSVRVRVVCNG